MLLAQRDHRHLLKSKHMLLDKPVVIEDFYKWLPGGGEDSVKLVYDRNLELIIEYFDERKGIDVSRIIKFNFPQYFYKAPLRGPEIYELKSSSGFVKSKKTDPHDRTYGKLIEYTVCDFCKKYEEFYENETGVSGCKFHYYSMVFLEQKVKISVISKGFSILDPIPV